MAAYLDSCIVMYLIEMDEPWCSRVRALVLPAAGPPPQLACSGLTRLECRVGPLRRRDADALSDDDQCFASPGLRRVTIDTPAFDLATGLRARHRIGVADALHIAAAVVAGCEEFWTNDLRLLNAAEGRLRMVTFDVQP
jgi:predicted nucleic acid-binding protein